ncbi:PH domain-containing protein [Actinomadura alba]|uniref:PH domain-containing protein n=2 Tax=Actinomadura alba TaxID=406431 RepID=A0ABR7LUA2_9ACTN|nr:PH domain-containing protein [Actinomadura alba]
MNYGAPGRPGQPAVDGPPGGYGPLGGDGQPGGYGPPGGYGRGGHGQGPMVHPPHPPPGYGAGYGPPLRPVHFSHGVHRLHWATALIRAMTVLVIYLAMAGPVLLGPSSGVTAAEMGVFMLVSVPFVVLAMLVGFWGWWSLRFWIGGDDLVVETGILRKRKRRISLSRVQAVDVVRPLVTRALNLAEVRVELAGGDRGEIALRFLGRAAAQRLRAELLARAAGLPGHTPEAPERLIWRVRFSTLLASLVLKVPVFGTFALFVALLLVGFAYAEFGVLGGAVPALLGLLRGVVAPLVINANFTVAMSPDGLRLRHGLLETRMQTVPPGRVQAIRIVEPSIWRSSGWARVDVTVAGYSGEREVFSSVLVPVAPREVAYDLVSLAFPGTDISALRLLPASGRSWSLDREAAAGADDVVFVSRRGLFCRSTDVIAHARAQSVRLSAGPLQRLLGLGTVHVDAPAGPVQVAAVNRDLEEARLIVESTAERARVARARGGDRPQWAR